MAAASEYRARFSRQLSTALYVLYLNKSLLLSDKQCHPPRRRSVLYTLNLKFEGHSCSTVEPS
jgi:hypothetical protein